MKKLLTALLIILILCIGTAAADDLSEFLGKPFPDFSLKDTKGNVFTLSEALQDHDAVLINILTTWCGPCIRELPILSEACRQYGDKVAFIGMSNDPDDSILDVANLRIENHVPFPMGRTAGTGIDEYLGRNGTPVTVIVDRFGNAVFAQIGRFANLAQITRLLDFFTADDYTETLPLTQIPAGETARNLPVSDTRGYFVENEGARKITIQYYDSDLPDTGYIVNSDTALVRFELTAEDNPTDFVYEDTTDNSVHDMLSLLDPERNAYVYSQPIPGPYSESIMYRQSALYENNIFCVFISSEEHMQEYIDYYESIGVHITWEYAD